MVYVSFKYFDYFWTVLVSLGLECCCSLYENGCCMCMFDWTRSCMCEQV